MQEVHSIAQSYWYVFVIAAGLIYIVNGQIKLLRTRGLILKRAHHHLCEFYLAVDGVLLSDQVPEGLKSTLFDILVVVSDDDVGSEVYKSLAASPERARSTPLDGLLEFMQTKPELEEQVFSAIRHGVAALILSHCHTDREMLAAFEGAQEPARVAESLAKLARSVVSLHGVVRPGRFQAS